MKIIGDGSLKRRLCIILLFADRKVQRKVSDPMEGLTFLKKVNCKSHPLSAVILYGLIVDSEVTYISVLLRSHNFVKFLKALSL